LKAAFKAAAVADESPSGRHIVPTFTKLTDASPAVGFYCHMHRQEAQQPAPQVNCSEPSSLMRKCIGAGLILGASFGLALNTLNFNSVVPGGGYFVPFFSICGAGIAITRVRKLLWLMNAMALIGIVAIAYTPLMRHLMSGLQRSDPPGRAPAVVVLSNIIFKDGTLNAEFQDRLLHGLEILRQGEAGTLVLTGPANASQGPKPTVQNEMSSLRIDFPVEEVGPVSNTHDEAVAVAALARQRGWDHVILVTQSWHMRRAAAAFERAGVKVICSPCPERSYDLQTLDGPGDRLRAFGDWMHETIGYEFYRWRGWV
jgi:uncharacterized SAM-binding protein YcdF (DUF218 family)